MPVETSIVCFEDEPGVQSRLMLTWISVSFVLREMLASLASVAMASERERESSRTYSVLPFANIVLDHMTHDDA